MEELEDHQQDIVDEHGMMVSHGIGLGNHKDLADRIVTEFRASRFVGRHPVLAFVITPIPLVIAAWMGVGLGLALLSSPLVEAVGTTGRNVGVYAIYLGLRFVPFIAAALLLCRLAYRSGRGGWSFVACVLVALMAGSLVANLTFTSTSREDDGWCSGLVLPDTRGRYQSVSGNRTATCSDGHCHWQSRAVSPCSSSVSSSRHEERELHGGVTGRA